MPTEKPRITITLTDHQHSVLSTMAKGQKCSMSSIVVDLLETAIPVLERVTELVAAAQRAPQQALDQLKQSLGRAETDVIGMQDAVMGQLDLLVREAGVAARGAARTKEDAPRAAALASVTSASNARRSAPERPPTSNRGVRITPTPQIPAVKTTTSKARKGVLKGPPGCTCTHTKTERMENKTCPVHFPAKRRRHAV
jgi:hypothetical protein